jgi:hypothetical protein
MDMSNGEPAELRRMKRRSVCDCARVDDKEIERFDPAADVCRSYLFNEC